ncbi:MAG: hypothetical protein J0M07_28220 [Anaerolineae bacterium]|nr:hypothetical protein [Anaerolineae bacterium]
MKRLRKKTILEQISEIRGRAQLDELARILDGLNALDALDQLRAKRFSPNLSWGAKAFTGKQPTPWVGGLIWHRPAGYFGYKTLTVIGVWAVAEAEGTRIIVGSKLLAFTAPFYEAEAYHKLIRDSFDLYYTDRGAPPEQNHWVFTTLYNPTQRLELRDQLPTLLAQCVT